jgi:hypothetical protein
VAPVDKTPAEQVQDAREARELLENRILREAFQTVEDVIVSQIKRSGLTDDSLHSHLSIALQMLDAVEQAIVQYVETGNAAETLLAEIGETK